MKRALILLLTLCNYAVSAQKEDYIWLSGYDSRVGYDTIVHHYLGINKLDFNFTPRHISYDSTLAINFDRTGISYSDTSGKILFYSNGIEIRNQWDEIIQNSRKMNDGYVINVWNPTFSTYGYRFPQADISLNIPNYPGKYLFFQCFFDSTTGRGDLFVPKLLTTYLSMSENNGHGKVLYRDSVLINDTLYNSISACRHANGRDWWLLIQKLNSNCYYRILLSEMGATVMPDKTCAGLPLPFGDAGQPCFSPDGSKYAIVDYFNGVTVYDFDRCLGMLSNPRNCPMPFLVDSQWAINGISFSPNSRFIYASITEYLFQFDTWLPLFSPDTIARFDSYYDPFGSYYCQSQLAPDGKIYIGTGNGEGNMSYIDSPDLKGSACHFLPHGLTLPAYQFGPPNNPNFRLGRLIGSSCDTLTAISETTTGQISIAVYPNPAQDYFIVDYGAVDWSRHDHLSLKIIDLTGRSIYATALADYSAIHRVNTVAFAAGIYLTQLIDADGKVLGVKRIVKE